MEDKEFQVEVMCRQRALYRVSAADAEAAERIAIDRWQNGDRSDLTGYDWCELLGAHARQAPDETRRSQDDEVVLRFIREREKLMARLGGQVVGAVSQDAISASQLAADLGWASRASDGGQQRIDAVRAADALERLCERRLLVCFERQRVRAGERGDIRLYCTPEYLNGLSADLDEAAPPLHATI